MSSTTLAWELLLCETCGHEYTRRADDRQTLPCFRCHSQVTRLPLEISEPHEFSLKDMIGALNAARDQASSLSITTTDMLERARYHGMALAYQETLDMLILAREHRS